MTDVTQVPALNNIVSEAVQDMIFLYLTGSFLGHGIVEQEPTFYFHSI